MTAKDTAALEKRIGHKFTDQSLLARALTHSSLSGGDRAVAEACLHILA